MLNSILEQTKVAEKGTDYMELVLQVKRQPVRWSSLENDKFNF